MIKYFVVFCCVLSLTATAQTGNYEKAWKALNENKRDEAEKFLQSAIAENNPASFQDAYITHLYLKSYNGKEKDVTDFAKNFYSKVTNPYPYIYALWFNDAILGGYGKKDLDRQVDFASQLISDSKTPGTLIAAANYQKGMHYTFSNEFEKAQQFYDAVGNVRNWQYTGPFENLSQSGFFKNYGPLEHPEPGAVFKSITNADVKWFSPPAENPDGWTPVSFQFDNSTAVVYAQNFVTSPADQPVYINLGISGSIKVWINDELVLAESKERLTEMDAYTIKYDLKKGVNRVLVQLGYTRNSYANFCLRITDENKKPLPGITGSPVYAPYSKGSGSKKYTTEPHFAEAFFQGKITSQPDNMINYLLLADVYLRSKKVIEARNLITDAIEKAPDNSLLKMKMVEILIKEENRTLLLEEIEKIKQADAESLVVLDLKIKELFDAQKFEDGTEVLEKRIRLFGEDASTGAYKIQLLIHEKKYEELVREAEKLFNQYPNNSKFISLMYNIKKEVYKDKKAAMKVYENFMKENYNYEVFEDYAAIQTELGNNDKALDIKKKLAESFPYEPSGYYKLAKYYFSAKKYDKAEEYTSKALALSPYNETYWEYMGDIKSEKNATADALDAYNKSLLYDPNQYTIINKIRKLNGKSETTKLFPEVDTEKAIKDDNVAEAKNTDYGYYYILDQKQIIIYPGGANEEYFTYIIRITNEKGVDRYKESSISYGNSQTLLIEKAEVIKKNHSKIEGERNENEIVFTNLEAGDVVVFKYRLRSYVYGRFAKEYWDRYYFGGQIYSSVTRYSIMAPVDLKLNYLFNNSGIKPVISDVENFKQYTWEMFKPEPEKDEPLMPNLSDVGTVLHVTTIPSWNEIGNWYSDICNNKAEEDFEIIALYKKLFPDGQKTMTQFQKAKIIYEYIESNIRYSSVSFRQSAYVPQRPSATLTTRLGDCKDLSSLFVTLARMAGIEAQMVLVDTRNNGEKEVLLPGVDFNHCVVKTTLDNKKYYVELTDNNLPFVSLPNNLIGSTILEIPYKNNTEKSELQSLKADNRTRDISKRYMDITVTDADLNITTRTVKYGGLSSTVRDEYKSLDNEKQLKDMEKAVANNYKNNVKMEMVKFKDLDKLTDSAEYSYKIKVKNEISEIGAIKTFRVTFPDVVASLDNFSAETRTYPVAYWSYEDADAYETIVNIAAPTGTKFIEVPASETLSFKDMKYTIQYVLKAPDKLQVIRKFTNGRQNIPAADYAAFKSFFEKVVKADQKFIAFK